MDSQDLRLGDLLTTASALRKQTLCAIAIIGVPQHIGVERNGGRPGAAGAPLAIRNALYRMATSAIVDVMLDHRLVVIDMGDIDTESKTLEQIHDQQHDVVVACMQSGMVPLVLGGGHDVAWPTIHALNTIGASYGVINIDAHADVRPMKESLPSDTVTNSAHPYAHSGSPFRQMLEAPSSTLADGAFVEFGLQPHAVSAAHLEYVASKGMDFMMLDDIRTAGVAQAWATALRRATGHATDGAPNSAVAEALYVSLDMDAFASAYAPGVSAPSADGFLPHEIATCLRIAGSEPTLRAFDVVEVNPAYDVDNRTSKLAATMIMQLLSGIAQRLR